MHDLISRQAAIEVIDAVMPVDPNKSEYASGIACGAALAMTYVKQLPSADRPQGEWIFDPEILCSDIGVYSAGYRCSVCGKDYFKVDRMNYCPNCGARMKGADDE